MRAKNILHKNFETNDSWFFELKFYSYKDWFSFMFQESTYEKAKLQVTW